MLSKLKVLVVALWGILPTSVICAQASDGDGVDFRRDVLPILSENCFACHGFDESARQSDLRLDIPDPSEQAIVAGVPAESELIHRIETDDVDLVMPPTESGHRLSEQQILLLKQWIAQGAEYKKHWAFEPPAHYPPPQMDGVSHPIDLFIQKRLGEAGLTPAERAENTKLLRRLSFDLVGLPPSPEQITAFLDECADDPDMAYRRAVERLLESPHYGERWGRWWLDQARYADSNGYSIDAPRQIWQFRDWVVQALNQDMPFDQFTVEQLAGDLLPDATQSQKIATGFHRNTQINQEGGIDKEQFRVDSVFDRVATTGTVWLGLTIGCAQCHDHKFDPISQREYYQLFAFFNNQNEPTLRVHDDVAALPELRKKLDEAAVAVDARIDERWENYLTWESNLTEAEIAKLPRFMRQALEVELEERSARQRRFLYGIEVGKVDGHFQDLWGQYQELNSKVNGVSTTLVLEERDEPRKTTILIKGDFTRPSEEVSPDTPKVLHQLPAKDAPNRLDLARWIVSPENPLTSRVIVNRVWQVFFGKGIVETENDFGTLGSSPTHPELLDWLAVEFQKRGWSLKELHRLIVTSNTYQQSSLHRASVAAKDPNNLLLARQERLRLEAELVRDTMLAVSGLLVPELGGPPVYPPIPDGVMNQGQINRKWVASQGPDRYRRGIYTFIYRATPPPSLDVFDAPDGFNACTRRSRSNTPLQALTLLNDASFV